MTHPSARRRCARCGQWKERAEFGAAFEERDALCLMCVSRLEREGGSREGWFDRLKRKHRERGSRPTLERAPGSSLPRPTWEPAGSGSGVTLYPSTTAYEPAAPPDKHRGTPVNGVARLMGSSYRGGLVLPTGGITVVLTPEALADVQVLSGKGGAWATAEGLGFPVLDKPRADVVFWPWPDMRVPTESPTAGDPVTIVRRILLLHQAHMAGRVIEVACFGGHGRTGMLLAVLAALAENWKPEEAVALLRKGYCQRAVETSQQERWVAKAVTAARIMKEHLTTGSPAEAAGEQALETMVKDELRPEPEPVYDEETATMPAGDQVGLELRDLQRDLEDDTAGGRKAAAMPGRNPRGHWTSEDGYGYQDLQEIVKGLQSIQQVAAANGVEVDTVKYYLRELFPDYWNTVKGG